jgi:hypothetical protein
MRPILRRTCLALAAVLAIVPAGAAAGIAYLGYAFDAADARLDTSDLDRFDRARAALRRGADTMPTLDAMYLAPASAGLAAYSRLYGIDAARMRRALRRRGAYYDSIADLPARVRAQLPLVRAAFARFEAAYPGAVFPPTYFLVSGVGPGGANGYRGLLLAADTYGWPDHLPDSAGRRWRTSDLPHLATHELVHFNQMAAAPLPYIRDDSNLARAIKEGVADFVAALVSGEHTNLRAHRYGRLHERALWEAFERDMLTDRTGEWFFTQPSDSARPPNLGYFVGYRIAEAWYHRFPDRRDRVAALIGIDDYRAFLAESGYDGGRTVPPRRVSQQ